MIRARLFLSILLFEALLCWPAYAKVSAYIPPRTVEVCTSGNCKYSTITAALAAITDATSTNPYIIRLHAGIYLESPLTWKSFVYLVGDGPESTKVYCSGSCITITHPDGTDDCGFQDVAIAGWKPVVTSGTGATGATLEFENVALGSIDGTLGTNSIDCILDDLSTGAGRTYEFNNSVCRSTFDTVRLRRDNTFRAVGSTFYIVSVSSISVNPRVFGADSTGNSFYLSNVQAYITDTGTSGSLWGMVILGSSPAPSVAESIQLNNVSFVISEGSSRTGATKCINFSASGDASTDVPVKLNNVMCQITRASSSGTISSLEIDASNHDEWVIDVNGFTSSLAGGATRNDIDNAETIAGFSLNVCGLLSGGVYTGAGTTTSCNQECAIIKDLAATDDNFEFWQPNKAVTLIGVGCRCRGTCTTAATFTLEDRGGNAMTITGTNPTCATTGNTTYSAMTTDADNNLASGEGVAFDVTNTPNPDGADEYTICVSWL